MKIEDFSIALMAQVVQLMPGLDCEEAKESGDPGVIFHSPERPERRLHVYVSRRSRTMRARLIPYFEVADEPLELERAVQIVEALAKGNLRGEKSSAFGRLIGYIIDLELRDGSTLEYRTPSLEVNRSPSGRHGAEHSERIDQIVRVAPSEFTRSTRKK